MEKKTQSTLGIGSGFTQNLPDHHTMVYSFPVRHTTVGHVTVVLKLLNKGVFTPLMSPFFYYLISKHFKVTDEQG